MSQPVTANPSLIDSPEALATTMKSARNGVFKLKPRVLFGAVENSTELPVDMQLHVPSSGIGSITLLEAAALVSVLHLTQPHRAFEFGTFLGYSTALLLRNTADACEVISIDLGDASATYSEAAHYSDAELRSDDKKNDDYLRLVQSAEGPRYLRGLSATQKARLKLLHGDSTQFDVGGASLKSAVDFVFVDGGHDTATIASDTRKAMEMTGDNGVIAWHDFDSKIHSDVTDFVHAFAKEHLVFHVENTMLAFLFKGNSLEYLLANR